MCKGDQRCIYRFGTKVHLWCRECIGEAVEQSGGRVRILPPPPKIDKRPATEMRGV